MKKRILAVALCVCTIFSMSACGKKDDKKSENTAGELKLGEYKNYVVGESATQVNDEDVNTYINTILNMYATTEAVKEGVTAENDEVEVTYHEFVDGAEVGEFTTAEDGTSKGITETVTLKSDGFLIAGFTDALIGKTVGETVEMDLQFPDDYSTTELAGKPVHITAVVNSIQKVNIPVYDDTFVSEHYSFAGYTTAADFTEFVKKEIYYIQINNLVWEDIIAAQTVVSYPSEELQKYVDTSYSQVESMMTSYGYTMDTYYQMLDKTKEEFMSELEEDCKKIVKEKMFVRKVAEKEGIQYKEEEAAKYAAISGYTSVDDFKKYLEGYGEELEYTVLSYQVQNFISENVKVVSDEETTAEETKAAEATTAAAAETTEETTVPEETPAE